MCPKNNDVEDDTYINNESKDKSTMAVNTLTLIPIFNEFIPQGRDQTTSRFERDSELHEITEIKNNGLFVFNKPENFKPFSPVESGGRISKGGNSTKKVEILQKRQHLKYGKQRLRVGLLGYMGFVRVTFFVKFPPFLSDFHLDVYHRGRK